MNRIILCEGQSQYNVLNKFIHELKIGFDDLGFETDIVDFRKSSWTQDLSECLKKGNIKLIFCFNGILNHLKVQDRLLIEDLGIPYFSFYVDHPYMHTSRLLTKITKQVISFVSEERVASAHDYLESINPVNISLIYHGASNPLAKEISYKDFCDRSNKPILFGSNKTPDPNFLHVENHFIRRSILEAIEEFETNKNLDEAISTAISNRRTLISGDQFIHALFKIKGEITWFKNQSTRQNLLEEISKSNIPAVLYGNSKPDNLGDNIEYGGAFDYNDTLKAIQNHQFILNDNAWVSQGSHERPLDALAAFSNCITLESDWYNSEFNDSLIMCPRDQLELIPELINQAQSDTERLYEMTRKGYQDVVSKHLWKHRALDIVCAADSVSL